MSQADPGERIRLDKWLWAARFFKTRALAAEAIDKGHIRINDMPAKASREPRVGDCIAWLSGGVRRVVIVKGLSRVRGPAPQAALLYEETEGSVQARALAAERRRLAPEPALSQIQGRPTKRDRRALETLHHADGPAPSLDARWSAHSPGDSHRR